MSCPERMTDIEQLMQVWPAEFEDSQDRQSCCCCCVLVAFP